MGTKNDCASDDLNVLDWIDVVSPEQQRFCYAPELRMLRAVDIDGRELWRFPLPGDNARNNIRAIDFAQGSLVVIAAVNSLYGGFARFEFSTFAPSGAFQNTYPIDYSGMPQPSDIADVEFLTLGTPDALYLSETGGEVVGLNALVSIDVRTGRKEAIRRFGQRLTDLELIDGGQNIRVTNNVSQLLLDATLLSESRQPLVSAGSRETIQLQAAQWIEGHWLADMLAAIPEELNAIGNTDSLGTEVTRNCPNGGEITVSGVHFYGISRLYNNCRVGNILLNGATRDVLSVSNSSLETTDYYDNFSISNENSGGVSFEVNGQVYHGNFSAGRQACQGINRFVVRAEFNRFYRTTSNESVLLNSSEYANSRGQTGSYNLYTNSCSYERFNITQADLSISNLLDVVGNWQITFTRDNESQSILQVISPDRTIYQADGAHDGEVFDMASWGYHDGVEAGLTLSESMLGHGAYQ